MAIMRKVRVCLRERRFMTGSDINRLISLQHRGRVSSWWCFKYKYRWYNGVFASAVIIWLKPQHLINHFQFSLVQTSWGHSLETRFYSQQFVDLTEKKSCKLNKSTFLLNILVTALKTLFHQNKLKRVSNTYENNNLYAECRIPEITSKIRVQYLSQMFHSEGGLSICSDATLRVLPSDRR